MDIRDKANVLIVYFSDETATNQIKMFQEIVNDVRSKHLGENWDGFNLGDALQMNGQKVMVFVKSENLVGSDEKYYVGPASMHPNKVDYDKLNFSDFVE